MGLLEVAAAGVELDTLRALRDRLAGEMDECTSARDVAALSARFMDVIERISAAERAAPATKGTALDELAKRRSTAKPAARGARAKGGGE